MVAKPHDQRDYTGMLQKYQAIELPAGHAMAPVVQAKLRYIQEMLRYQKETEEIARLVREARTTSERFDQARDEITVTTTTRPVTRYAAQGILAASDLFPGTGAVPKRWIVRDPQTLRVDAYVQATTQQVELKRYEGKLVGIHGKAVFDAALGLDIVEAERLVVLDESVKLPMPPQPILKVETPQPKLAPTPPVAVPGLGKPGDKPAAPTKPAPVTPAPVKPVPVTPAPAKLAPVEPAPVKPVPAVPAPAKLAPVEPAPVRPDPPRPDADKPIFPPEPAPAKPAPTTKPATSSIVVPIPPPPPVDTRVIVIPPTTQPAPTTKPAPKTKPASAIINLPPPSGLPLE